jgi:catalase
MTPTQREHLHSNTAALLKYAEGIVQSAYLTQLYAIDPAYAKAIFDLLPKHDGYGCAALCPLARGSR